MQKVVLALKNCFRPANGVRSTRLLVEINNRWSAKRVLEIETMKFDNTNPNVAKTHLGNVWLSNVGGFLMCHLWKKIYNILQLFLRFIKIIIYSFSSRSDPCFKI